MKDRVVARYEDNTTVTVHYDDGVIESFEFFQSVKESENCLVIEKGSPSEFEREGEQIRIPLVQIRKYEVQPVVPC